MNLTTKLARHKAEGGGDHGHSGGYQSAAGVNSPFGKPSAEPLLSDILEAMRHELS